MPSLCLTRPGLRVRLESESLIVENEPGAAYPGPNIPHKVPLHDIDRVLLSEKAHLTSPALAELLRRNIPIAIHGYQGKFLGSFLPENPSHGNIRLRQYQRAADPTFTLHIARHLIEAKIYNQRRILQRLAANRASSNPQALAPLNALLSSAARATTLESLRGFEGAAAAHYFDTWSSFLPDTFPFERRSTRPPLNPVNACLSFGATLLYQEATAFLHAHGLDPALGHLHTTEDGRWSLALDLIEPFRPIIVEALTLDLFSHQMLRLRDFESRDGGVFLTREGRGTFILQYERRLERPFSSEHVGHRTTLRLQLEQAALDYKNALDAPETFSPFLMN